MDTQEAQDALVAAVAAFAEECAYDGIDPDNEVERLVNNVRSAFWSTYNGIDPEDDDTEQE